MLNWLLIVVLVLFAVFIIRGWRKGLLRLLFSLVSVIVLIVVMAHATPHVSTFIREHTGLYTMVEEKCTEQIQKKMESGLENSAGQTTEKAAVAGVSLPEQAAAYIVENTESMIEKTGIYQNMGSRAADLIVRGISFFVTLILAIVLLKIIDRLLGIANHIPVIKGINRTLGLFGGALEAFIIISLGFMFIAMIAGTQAGTALTEQIDQSMLLSYLYYKNPLLGLFSGFSAGAS